MSQNVRDILRTGDICEIKEVAGIPSNLVEVGQTFVICIEGKLYSTSDAHFTWEVENFDDLIIRILRPTKMEYALEMWRTATEETWRSYIRIRDIDTFKTVYIKNEYLGLTLKILERTLSYNDERIINCVKNALEFNPTYSLRLLYELINGTIQPLLSLDKYGIGYIPGCILINRMSDQKCIAEITKPESDEVQ